MSGSTSLSAISADEFEQIESALVESARGRWFLGEFARRNRTADTEMLLGAINRLESAVVQERVREPEPEGFGRLRGDLMEMASAIARTKAEIAAISDPAQDQTRLSVASEALDAIVRSTERATSEILSAAEEVQEAAWTLRERGIESALCDALDRHATQIYTACSFQDLTAQRTSRIVHTLRYLEERLIAMIGIWGEDAPVPPEAAARGGAAPPTQDLSQTDVDRFIDMMPAGEDAAAPQDPTVRDALAALELHEDLAFVPAPEPAVAHAGDLAFIETGSTEPVGEPTQPAGAQPELSGAASDCPAEERREETLQETRELMLEVAAEPAPPAEVFAEAGSRPADAAAGAIVEVAEDAQDESVSFSAVGDRDASDDEAAQETAQETAPAAGPATAEAGAETTDDAAHRDESDTWPVTRQASEPLSGPATEPTQGDAADPFAALATAETDGEAPADATTERTGEIAVSEIELGGHSEEVSEATANETGAEADAPAVEATAPDAAAADPAPDLAAPADDPHRATQSADEAGQPVAEAGAAIATSEGTPARTRSAISALLPMMSLPRVAARFAPIMMVAPFVPSAKPVPVVSVAAAPVEAGPVAVHPVAEAASGESAEPVLALPYSEAADFFSFPDAAVERPAEEPAVERRAQLADLDNLSIEEKVKLFS